MTGESFGRWTVLEELVPRLRPKGKGRGLGRERVVRARCACGAIKVVALLTLQRGKSQSCGCLRSDRNRDRAQHGEARKAERSPEYRAWQMLRSRVLNEADPRFEDYGGRGIKIDPRWDSFENFLADMGRRPSVKHSIDRKDNDGDYTPENCRWATPLQQANNKSNRQTTNGTTPT